MQISRHYHGFGFHVCQKAENISRYIESSNNGATTVKVTTVLLTSLSISIISGTNHYSLSSPQPLKTNVSSPSCHLHMWIMPSAPIVRSNILTILPTVLRSTLPVPSPPISPPTVSRMWSLPQHQTVHRWDGSGHLTSGWPICSCVSPSCSTNTWWIVISSSSPPRLSDWFTMVPLTCQNISYAARSCRWSYCWSIITPAGVVYGTACMYERLQWYKENKSLTRSSEHSSMNTSAL